MWQTPAELHAALNDFPAVLLLVTLAFEVAGGLTRRESFRAAGFWTLILGAAGAVLAVISGLRAESTIEHGGSVHMIMERHETLAITVTVLFGLLAAWRIWRRTMGGRERTAYLLGLGLGGLLVIWTSHIGGTMVFQHAGGVPTAVLEGALAERAVPHTHSPGEEHEQGTAEADSTTAPGDHEDAPGTPAHEHD